MYRSKTIGVVIPAFNEARFIKATLSGLPTWVDRIVVIDDASVDGTSALVREEMKGNKRLSLFRSKLQLGPGGAILKGYNIFAREGSCQIVVVMAGDNQMHPDDLPGLLDPICEGRAAYVKGTRFRDANLHSIMPWTRYIGNRALSWLTGLISGYREIEDAQCGFTALKSTLLTPVLKDGLVPGYGLPNAILVFLASLGVSIAQVPVRPIYRDEESGLNFLTVLRVYPLLLIKTWWSKSRLTSHSPRKHETGA